MRHRMQRVPGYNPPKGTIRSILENVRSTKTKKLVASDMGYYLRLYRGWI